MLELEKNESGNDYVVGDIGGAFDKLEFTLDAIDFDPKLDRVFVSGSTIGDSDSSLAFIDWCKENWFFPILGPQELLYAYSNKLINRLILGRSNSFEKMSCFPESLKIDFYNSIVKLPLGLKIKGEKDVIICSMTNMLKHDNCFDLGLLSIKNELSSRPIVPDCDFDIIYTNNNIKSKFATQIINNEESDFLTIYMLGKQEKIEIGE